MSQRLSPDDTALMRRIADRDQTALAELYAHYARPVYNLALLMLQNASTADEVTQDVFLQVWREPERWSPEKGRLSSWLLAITRILVVEHKGRDLSGGPSQTQPLDKAERLLVAQSVVDDPQWDDGRLLRTLLRKLPPEQLQAIQLAFFRGMTHTEIAAHLGIPEGTVKSRIRIGLRRLRDLWRSAVRE